MNAKHTADLLNEHHLQVREREEANLRPIREVLASMMPLTPAQYQAQRRARLLEGGWGTAMDVNR